MSKAHPGENIFVVLPAYNAERTIARTVADIPRDCVDAILVVDDGSTDRTAEIARSLGLTTIVHQRNAGYGANQKTCYDYALSHDASIVVMVHPDYQYDPKRIPELITPIVEHGADVVIGSRFNGADPRSGAMPIYKYLGNRFLTAIGNAVFATRFSEFHSGFRAFRASTLRAVHYRLNSDGFLFDFEIITHLMSLGLTMAEIAVPAKYEADSSSLGFLGSVYYGLSTLSIMTRYYLHRKKIRRFARLSGQGG